MKILLDENFPEGFKIQLSKKGYDVKHINHIQKGMTDKEVFNYALKNKRIIISNDIDFKKFIKKNKHYGVIKFDSSIYEDIVLLQILDRYGKDKLKDNYIELSKKGIFFYTKIYSKKGNYKQMHRLPIYLD